MRRAAIGARPIEVVDVREDGAHGQIRIWERPSAGSRYVLALDPSEGTGGDPAAGTIREWGTAQHCATIHGQFKPHALARIAADLGESFEGATIVVERNNHGHAVLQALEREHHYRRIFRHYDGKPGWLNNEVTRTKALTELDEGLRSGFWFTLDDAILGEMRTFITTPNGRVEAARGSHDDLVLVEAIALDALTKSSGTRRQDTSWEDRAA
jgi:phage terminase large subunit-like protein